MNELSSFQLLIITAQYNHSWSSQVALVVKTLSANARDIRDKGLILGLGRFLEEGMATLSSILIWRVPWTEEPGSLQSIGMHRIGHD